MRRMVLGLAGIVVIAVVMWVATRNRVTSTTTGGMQENPVVGEYVTPEDSLPKLRYFATNLVSVNDRCAVRKVKLNPKMPPVHVNGDPVGFC